MKKRKDTEIPNTFWKYYDLYRRGQITIQIFSIRSGLTKDQIRKYMKSL